MCTQMRYRCFYSVSCNIEMTEKKHLESLASTLHCCSCCITPRGYEFIQCSSIWHPVHQERTTLWLWKQISLSALCVLALSPTLILPYSFCGAHKEAAQEILFRYRKTQREWRKSEMERGLFLAETISHRIPLARLRKPEGEMTESEAKLQLWHMYLWRRSLQGGVLIFTKIRRALSFFFRSSLELPTLDLGELHVNFMTKKLRTTHTHTQRTQLCGPVIKRLTQVKGKPGGL